jgi:PAS domain S-box-containing protein
MKIYPSSQKPVEDYMNQLQARIVALEQGEAELKREWETLNREKARCFNLIEKSNDIIYETDDQGRLTFINQVTERISGYSRGEFIGRYYLEFIDPNFRREAERLYGKQFVYKIPDTYFEFPLWTKDNRKIWLGQHVQLKTEGNNIIGFQAIARDITKQKQAEEALKKYKEELEEIIEDRTIELRMKNELLESEISERRQAEAALKISEEKYRTILETIEDGYYEVDLRGNLTFFNDVLPRLHECPRDELMGLNNRQYTDPENAKRLYKAFNQVYLTGEPSRATDYEITTKKGMRKRFESSVSLTRDFSGKPIGFHGIVRDMTELRSAQRSLQKSEERFRIAAQSSNDFIYEWNLESGQIDWFGDAFEKLSNLLNEIPFTATAFQKIIYPDDYNHFLEAIRRHLRERGSYKDEYRIVGKDGRIIHVKAAGMGLRNRDGKVYKWIGALSDITDQKRTEEELKESLEKLHKAMGGIIKAMTLTVENRDPYTAGHQQRVSSLARVIGQEMGLSKDQIEAIRMAGSVHDLGKISVPVEILSKPRRLSDIEFSLIKIHPQTSYDILKDIEFPWPIAQIVLQHHERINGSGYPAGLKGQEILLEAKVLMVADVVEAISSHRPYRPSKGINAALEEISQNKGILYDPAVVDACLRQFNEKGYAVE